MVAKKYSIEDVIDYMETWVMADWISIRDAQKENNRQNENCDPKLESRLSEVLDMFHEKDYKEGFVKYISWLKDYNGSLRQDDFDLLQWFAKDIGFNPGMMDGIPTYKP